MASQRFILVTVLFLFSFITNINAQESIGAKDPLDSKQQSIIIISAFTAKGDLLQLQKALAEGLDAGLTVNEIKEVLVQLYAYAGFPRSLNAITSLESVVNDRKQKGMEDAPGKEPSKVVSTKSKFEFGKDVQTKLTGTTVTGAPQRFVPIIDTFLKEHLFADILSREILDFKTREIATISALASIGGAEGQLRSHFNVGLNTGLTKAQLKRIVSVLQTKVGSKEGNTADEILQSLLNRKEKITQPKGGDELRLHESNKESVSIIFPKGEKITNGNFNGNAWLASLVTSDSLHSIAVGNVTFEPGARTNWHLHPGGQILMATGGIGYYQEKGSTKRILRKGDVVKCPPNVAHWHGASCDHEFIQIAITSSKKGPAVWLQPVTDDEYYKPPLK